MVEEGEEYLSKFSEQVRVRIHGRIARIEVLSDDIEKVLKERKEVVKKLKRIGFSHVSIDLEGYREGSMNVLK